MADKDKGRRYCDYKNCGLPESNGVFLIQFLYMVIVFLVLIKDFTGVTILNMVLFIAPSTIDVICFKHQGKVNFVFKSVFIAIIIVIVVFAVMIAADELTDKGGYYLVANTFPIIGGIGISKWVLLILSCMMSGVPLFMYFARPSKKQAQTIELLAEAMGGK